jgi:hypothetical protein
VRGARGPVCLRSPFPRTRSTPAADGGTQALWPSAGSRRCLAMGRGKWYVETVREREADEIGEEFERAFKKVVAPKLANPKRKLASLLVNQHGTRD